MLYQKLLEFSEPYFVDLSHGGKFEEHCHPEIELSFCVKGSYNIIINQKEYTLNCGELAIINPMVPHELGNDISKDSVRLTIEVGPAFLGEQFDALVLKNCDSKLLKLNEENKSCSLLKLFLETSEILMKKPAFYNIDIKGNIYKISAVLLNKFNENSECTETVAKSLLNVEKISRAVNMIYGSYDKQLSLDTVSAFCGYSKSNFCKTFKVVTGESFHSMLNRHRIDVACLKLKKSDASIEEIALSVGFLDSKSFCRVFKKIMGKNAGEYRKK
ncbi:MAG: AraC family transcriptional regulator [Ruminococcaceae bacterium]|nr:AraC family transcriptional regulator [Oscillospiraceae bacterium]